VPVAPSVMEIRYGVKLLRLGLRCKCVLGCCSANKGLWMQTDVFLATTDSGGIDSLVLVL
jgi:hypothetical protein